MRRRLAESLAIVLSVASLGAGAASGPSSLEAAKVTPPPVIEIQTGGHKSLKTSSSKSKAYQTGTASWYGEQFQGNMCGPPPSTSSSLQVLPRDDPQVMPPRSPACAQQTIAHLVEALMKSAETTLGRCPLMKRITDDNIIKLSQQQRDMRVRINAAATEADRVALRHERMLLLRNIHKITLASRRAAIDAKVKDIEQAKDNTQFFLAVKQLRSWIRTSVTVNDDQAHEVKDPKEKAGIIVAHFRSVFHTDKVKNDLTPFAGMPHPLRTPIHVDEIIDR